MAARRDSKGRFLKKGQAIPGDSIRSFELNVGHFLDFLMPQKANDVKAKVALQVLTGVVEMTPVDTGHARANWQVTIGNSPATGEIDGEDDPQKNGGGSETIIKGAIVADGVGVGDDMWIHNNLPYILPLEDGHSEQAPNGMVAVTMARINEQFK